MNAALLNKIAPILMCALSLCAIGKEPDKKQSVAQQGINSVKTVSEFPDYVAACMKIDAMIKKSKADLHLIKEYEKNFGWVGTALGLADAGLAAYEGRDIDALQKVGDVSADALICTYATHACPAWAVGRTIGGVINTTVSMIRSDKRDATDLLEDIYLSVNTEAPLTARELLRLEMAVSRAKARRSAMARAKMCSDPTQTRNGVDELLRSIVPQTAPQLLQTEMPTSCSILENTTRSEALMAQDPDAYDRLLSKCLNSEK